MVCDCGASCWGFFCGCFCCACGGCAAWTAAGPLRLLYNPSGCVCLFCSCAVGVGWAAAFSFAFSVPHLRRLAWQCSLGGSPCEVAFRGGLLALVVSGYAKEVVTSLCLGVLWCLRTATFSDFGFSYVWVWLHLLLRFAGCGLECLLPCWILSCLCGCSPLCQVWHCCIGVLAR